MNGLGFIIYDSHMDVCLFCFDHLDPTIFLPSNRGPDMLKNVMSTNKRIKIEKLEHDLNDFLIQYFVVRCHFSSQSLL